MLFKDSQVEEIYCPKLKEVLGGYEETEDE
jgi:hypothetical protein